MKHPFKFVIPEIPPGADPIGYLRGYNGCNTCELTMKEIEAAWYEHNLPTEKKPKAKAKRKPKKS